jgi:hypothetical protein
MSNKSYIYTLLKTTWLSPLIYPDDVYFTSTKETHKSQGEDISIRDIFLLFLALNNNLIYII